MKINYKEVVIITMCPFCGHVHEVAVNEADYWDWKDGALVQDVFPYLTADEREMLISGICPTCWEKTFGILMRMRKTPKIGKMMLMNADTTPTWDAMTSTAKRSELRPGDCTFKILDKLQQVSYN